MCLKDKGRCPFSGLDAVGKLTAGIDDMDDCIIHVSEFKAEPSVGRRYEP